MNLTEIAAVFGFLIPVLAAAIVLVIREIRSVHKVVAEINHAVNGTPSGEASIQTNVRSIMDEQASVAFDLAENGATPAIRQVVADIWVMLNRIEKQLKPKPAPKKKT